MLQHLEVRGGRNTFGDEAGKAARFAARLRELRLELCDFLLPRVFARDDLAALALQIGRVFCEAGLLQPRDDLAGADRLSFFGHARRQAAVAGKRDVEALFLGKRQQTDLAAVVVLLAHERPVPPGACHSNGEGDREPDSLFHPLSPGKS